MNEMSRVEWINMWKKNKAVAIRRNDWNEVERIRRIITLAEKGAEVMVTA